MITRWHCYYIDSLVMSRETAAKGEKVMITRLGIFMQNCDF